MNSLIPKKLKSSFYKIFSHYFCYLFNELFSYYKITTLLLFLINKPLKKKKSQIWQVPIKEIGIRIFFFLLAFTTQKYILFHLIFQF
jgi:hypothetical protein